MAENLDCSDLTEADVLFMNPENRAVLAGKPQHFTTNSPFGYPLRRLGLLPFFLLVTALVALYAAIQQQNIAYFIPGVAGLCIIGLHFWFARRRAERLRRDGRVLRGRVDSCRAQELVEEEGSTFKIRIIFEFCTPDRRILRQQYEFLLTDRDFDRFIPPEPGAPIAVLYVDDKLYELL